MAGERTVKIKFLGDEKDLVRAAGAGGKAVGGWKESIKGFATAVGGLALAHELFDFAKESVKAFAEAEEAQHRLEDAFGRFPKLADTNIEAFRALNTELGKKTRFDDDAFASGQAVLAQFDLTGTQIKNITPLLADYAAKTGQDLPGAATTLGKAFLGNTRALKELGISYKSTGDKATDIANITQLVRDKVGGFAEKEGKTATGQAAILGNQFQDLQETLGSKLLPVLMALATAGLATIDWISKNQAIVIPLISAIGLIVIAQWAWNSAMLAWPGTWIILGIAALVVAIIAIVKHVGWFRAQWDAAWKWVVDTGKGVIAWFTGLPGAFGTIFGKVTDIILWPFKTAFNAVATLWNRTIGSIGFDIPSWIPLIGGKSFHVPKIPTFHTGGVVGGAGEVLARLRGGEGVFTPEQMAAMGGAGNIEVHVFIGDKELTDMINVQVTERNRGTRRAVAAGATR